MPTYIYRCEKEHQWDVVKPMSQLDAPERCEACGEPGTRQIARVNFNGASDWNSQTFNPALGCYTRNTRHARQIAKSRGYEEIGNEPVEKIHSTFEKQREETRAKRWAEADREKLYGE